MKVMKPKPPGAPRVVPRHDTANGRRSIVAADGAPNDNSLRCVALGRVAQRIMVYRRPRCAPAETEPTISRPVQPSLSTFVFATPTAGYDPSCENRARRRG